MNRSEFRSPDPYGVARLLANDSDFQRSVIHFSEPDSDQATAPDPRIDCLTKQAPLAELLAGSMVYCERVLPKLPVEKIAASLTMSFLMLLLFIVVKRAPLVRLHVESNEVTTTITTGPDDDVRAQFKRAERLALAQQRRLRGYRGPSRGLARNARSTYFAYLEVLHRMTPAAIWDHWLELTRSWLAGAVPKKSSPRRDAYIEWRATSQKREDLEETNIRATLRAWRTRHEGSAMTLGLVANVAAAG